MIHAKEARLLPPGAEQVLADPAAARQLEREDGADVAAWLGLHGDPAAPHLGFFVGVTRFPVPDAPIVNVAPRFADLDYAKMFADCAADRVVSAHLGDVFHVWPDAPYVPVPPDVEPWFRRLLIYAYLRETAALCSRHLRRGSFRVVENLTGRVRGRILVGGHVRRNLARQRPDRVVCAYAVLDPDTILRAALDAAAGWLHHRPAVSDDTVQPLIRTARAALAGVAQTRIHPRDHFAARRSGTMAQYRKPLQLARAVLETLGVDPQDTARLVEPRDVPPFAIATSELFERYCEALLRRQTPTIIAFYKNNIGRRSFRIRPDFLYDSEREGWVIDAKFKEDWRVARKFRSDVYQVVSYTRHYEVLGAVGGERPRIAILFPAPEGGWDGTAPFALAWDRRWDDYETTIVRVPVFVPRRAASIR